jgi:hypothetical protein
VPSAVAVNVGANTNEPGFRGPVYPDGSFEFLPIPESEPLARDAPAPTYGDLDPHLRFDVPEGVRDTPVHLDPEFAGYPRCERYTYGDPYGVKARPLLDLDAGDRVYFYATLTARGDGHPEWVPPEWGAFLIGEFRLARDPIPGTAYPDLPGAVRERFRNNAHVRRETMDAAVLLLGSPESRCYERAVPLSGERGVEANRLVTEHSEDSGKGPWWRRPLRYQGGGAAALREAVGKRTPGSGK